MENRRSAGQVALLVFVAAASAHLFSRAQPPASQGPDFNAYYQMGPDSLPHDGVPKGEVRGPFVLPSQEYPGTQHTYWVYVPAQYDAAVAASLTIFQDGQAFKDLEGVVRAPNVLDNLIYRREVPVMIAVFINPGRTPEQPEPTPSDWGDRTTNRPTEYNSLDDRYARVVVDELMPVLSKEYNISRDPDRHAIGGASSGAIAAFTVAWQRPNDFRKVLSIVGSFVNLRGGDAYPDLIRQSDKKPIRIFLQDGRNDNRGVGRGGTYDQRRDWFYQNVRLMQALTDKGYDVNYTWGMNTHGQRMGGPILPEMLRWLWRDHTVSTDVNDAVERSFNGAKKNELPAAQAPEKGPPREWIDPDTGHRVVRLSDEPGSQSLYFHQNAYTPDGAKLIITTPSGLDTISLKTRAIEKVVEGRVNLIMTGRKTGQAYYVRMGTVYAVNLDTKVSREIAKIPPRGSIATVNADESLLAGTITEGTVPDAPEARGRDSYPGKDNMMERRLAARLPMQLFTLDIKTGEAKTILRSTDWLNHLQFSPTDPALLLFCHEGPWHKVDRTWTIRTDGTGLTQIHHRTMNMEIEGHEFFSGDGRQIWYDLQTPRSEVFWLAGYELATAKRIWYHLERSEWSVHFNLSPDGTLFAGDGGGPSSVAAPGNGQWIYLFRPQLVPDRTDHALPSANELIQPGVLKAEKLVNLARHDYSLEPNVTFTPDMRWIVFRSNMFGPTHVFAVEVSKK